MAIGTEQKPNHWWQRLDHRRPRTLLLVAIAGLYGIMIANLLPEFVAAWISRFGLSARTAGNIATLNLLAHSAGLGCSLFLVRRWPLPKILRLGLGTAVVGDVVSVIAGNITTLAVFRCIAGLGLGLQFGATTNWIGRNENSVRGFAMFVMLQYGLSALLFIVIPVIKPLFGDSSVYVVLAPLALGSLLLASLYNLNGGDTPLSASGPGAASDVRVIRRLRFAQVLAVSAFAFFNVAAIGVWAHLEHYGTLVGLSTAQVATALAMSSLGGIPGALVVLAIGDRFGRLLPALIGLFVFALPLVAFAFASVASLGFVVGVTAIGFAWNIVQPYFQSTQSRLDRTGQLAVTAMFIAIVAGSFGPALIGHLADGGSYGPAFEFALAALALSAFASVFPAIFADTRISDT